MVYNSYHNLRRGIYTPRRDSIVVGERHAEGYTALTTGPHSNAIGTRVAITDVSRVHQGETPTGTAQVGYSGLAVSFDSGGAAEAGQSGMAVSWFGGHAKAGEEGFAVVRRSSPSARDPMAEVGDYGVALASPRGLAKVAEFGVAISVLPLETGSGSASGGKDSVLLLQWFPPYSRDKTYRPRVAVAYVGEDGILPDVVYTVDKQGNVIPKDPIP